MRKLFNIVLSIILCACCLFSFTACDDKTVNSADIVNPRTETIKIGYVDYAPLNYKYKGKFTGFNTKLAVSIFNTLGYNVKFVLVEPTDEDRRTVNADDVYCALDEGDIDCFFGGITDAVLFDETRFDFSYRYMENSPCLVIVNGQNYINCQSDFNDKTVAFGENSSGKLYYNNYLANVSGIDYVLCEKGQSSALHKANSPIEDASCAIVDTLFAYYNLEKTNEYGSLILNAKNNPDAYQIEQKNYLRAVFKKDTSGTNELRDNVNKTLEFLASTYKDGVSLLCSLAQGTSFSTADLSDFLITDFSSQK